MRNFLVYLFVVIMVIVSLGVLANLFFAGIGLLLFTIKFLLVPAVVFLSVVYVWKKFRTKN
jgi:hypothetical protein